MAYLRERRCMRHHRSDFTISESWMNVLPSFQYVADNIKICHCNDIATVRVIHLINI